MIKQSELVDYNIMKVITMLLVVIGHVTMLFKLVVTPVVPQISSNILQSVFEYIYSFHMPAFIGISGAIYFHIKRECHKYSDPFFFIKNKARRLLIPYVFFAAFVVFPTNCMIGNINVYKIKYIFLHYYVLGFSPDHLWFLLTIFFIFIIFNTFEKIIYQYTVLFLLIFSTLCIFFIEYIPNWYLSLNRIGVYLICFYLGYLFQRHKSILLPFFKKYISFIVLIIIHISLYVYPFKISLIFVSYVKMFLIAMTGCLIIYLISFYYSQTKLSDNKFIKKFSTNSFGIYLFHQPIIYVIFFLCHNYEINPFLLAFTSIIASITIAYFLTESLRAFKLKILIGE